MSIARHHVCACVNTEVRRFARRPLRILDAGCGDGSLILLLQQLGDVEVYGFDVDDARVQSKDFFAGTLSKLRAGAPHVDWSARLAQVRSSDPWPFEDGFFDIAVSNQVLEHVHDPEHFFGQMARVLAEGGVAIHLFPLSSCFMEWHLNLPFAHWITDHDLLLRYLRAASRLGLGKYKTMRFLSLDEWCEQHADYLLHETNYLSADQVTALAKRHHLRCTFKYTGGFYTNKLRQLRKARLLESYDSGTGALLTAALARVSCVTARMEKRNSYPGAHPVQ